MGSGGKQRSQVSSHESFKTKAKNRVDDLQGMFCDLQRARKENRAAEVALLEEQVNQMLREWKAELHDASPASSLVVASPSSSELSSDMKRLLQLHEEDDDASSSVAAWLGRPLSEQQRHSTLAYSDNQQVYNASDLEIPEQAVEEEMLERLLRSEFTLTEPSPLSHEESLTVQALLISPSLSMQEPFSPRMPSNGFGCSQDENSPPFESVVSPPPAAFLGPKCALWDCPRPAHGSEWYQDYCSAFHASLAVSEGAVGRSPVVRPCGIDLKDGPLFSALTARSQHKAVGIPECEGAATSKSPWNAHDLFDISVLQGEVIREWLFFDKPRRAFESGTRKQRSLPDYNGRGWHESRKQIMKDMGGLKRSYYMDPQPDFQFEWHLYEYELPDYDACALYRLELKQVNLNKKSCKAKIQHDQVTALQNQIGRLSADGSVYDAKVWLAEPKSGKGRAKATQKFANRGTHFTDGQAAFMADNTILDNSSSQDYTVGVSSYLVTPEG